MPNSRRCSPGPIPDSISSFGVSIAPALTITSRRALTVAWVRMSGVRYSTPVATPPSSITTRLTQQ